jgi:hypothetical protein
MELYPPQVKLKLKLQQVNLLHQGRAGLPSAILIMQQRQVNLPCCCCCSQAAGNPMPLQVYLI